MKKTIQLTLLLITFLSMTSNKAHAVTVKNEDGVTIFYNYIGNGEALSVTYLYSDARNRDAYIGDVVIPEEVTVDGEQLKVVSIDSWAFRNCSGLTSVTIPNSVVTIGGSAFSGCTSLTEITIPNSVVTIGSYAFQNCSNLTSFIIGNSVKGISGAAFENCTNLTYVTFHCKEIKNWFLRIKSIKEVIIGEEVETIGSSAFYECTGLTSVAMGNSVTNIDSHAFSGCSSLLEVTLPNTVTSIGDVAFKGCSSLTSVTIPNSVTSIGNEAFRDCSSLTSVTIPNSVTSIGGYAFSGCSGLTEMVIPNSVTKIGEWAFQNCSGLTSVTIGYSVKTIGYSAFYGCSALTSVISEMEYPCFISEFCFPTNVFNNTSLYVPKGTIDIYRSMFYWKKFMYIIEGTPFEHTISYLVDDNPYTSYMLKEGETINPIDEPIKEGYSFSGWSEIPSTMPSHDVTIRGTFTVNKYKVIYMVDGAEYETTEVEYGSTVTVEAEPTKEGYTFSGWSDIPATMPAKDVIVTGTFTVNKYKLIYTIDGKEYKTVEVEYGSTITPEQTPEGDYVTFEWIGIPETMPAHDVTVTATYTTGINSTPISRDEDNKGVNYNLNGQRIEGQPSQKGVYIKNDKKVLMK